MFRLLSPLIQRAQYFLGTLGLLGLLGLLMLQSIHAEHFLNELMATNSSELLVEDGEASNWVETSNP